MYRYIFYILPQRHKRHGEQFSISRPCASPAGNVSLVNRLILDAGLTAELVKVWKEQAL